MRGRFQKKLDILFHFKKIDFFTYQKLKNIKHNWQIKKILSFINKKGFVMRLLNLIKKNGIFKINKKIFIKKRKKFIRRANFKKFILKSWKIYRKRKRRFIDFKKKWLLKKQKKFERIKGWGQRKIIKNFFIIRFERGERNFLFNRIKRIDLNYRKRHRIIRKGWKLIRKLKRWSKRRKKWKLHKFNLKSRKKIKRIFRFTKKNFLNSVKRDFYREKNPILTNRLKRMAIKFQWRNKRLLFVRQTLKFLWKVRDKEQFAKIYWKRVFNKRFVYAKKFKVKISRMKKFYRNMLKVFNKKNNWSRAIEYEFLYLYRLKKRKSKVKKSNLIYIREFLKRDFSKWKRKKVLKRKKRYTKLKRGKKDGFNWGKYKRRTVFKVIYKKKIKRSFRLKGLAIRIKKIKLLKKFKKRLSKKFVKKFIRLRNKRKAGRSKKKLKNRIYKLGKIHFIWKNNLCFKKKKIKRKQKWFSLKRTLKWKVFIDFFKTFRKKQWKNKLVKLFLNKKKRKDFAIVSVGSVRKKLRYKKRIVFLTNKKIMLLSFKRQLRMKRIVNVSLYKIKVSYFKNNFRLKKKRLKKFIEKNFFFYKINKFKLLKKMFKIKSNIIVKLKKKKSFRFSDCISRRLKKYQEDAKFFKVRFELERKKKTHESWEKAKQRLKKERKIHRRRKKKNVIRLRRKKILKIKRSVFIAKNKINKIKVRKVIKIFKRRARVYYLRKKKYLQHSIYVRKRNKNKRLIFYVLKAKKWNIQLNNKTAKKTKNKRKVKRYGRRVRSNRIFYFVKRMQSGKWIRRRKKVFQMRETLKNFIKKTTKNLPNNLKNYFANPQKKTTKETLESFSTNFINNINILLYRIGLFPSLSLSIEAVKNNWFCINFEVRRLKSSVIEIGDSLTIYPSFEVFSNYLWIKQLFIRQIYALNCNKKEFYRSHKPFLFCFIKIRNKSPIVNNTAKDWIKLAFLRNVKLIP